jgi:hypothetical protein
MLHLELRGNVRVRVRKPEDVDDEESCHLQTKRLLCF